MEFRVVITARIVDPSVHSDTSEEAAEAAIIEARAALREVGLVLERPRATEIARLGDQRAGREVDQG